MKVSARLFIVASIIWLVFICWVWASGGRHNDPAVDSVMVWVAVLPIAAIGAFVWALKGFDR